MICLMEAKLSDSAKVNIATAGKILLIDSDAASLKTLGLMLEKEGFETFPAVDTRSAMAIIDRPSRPDIIISEIMTSEGLQLLHSLRNNARLRRVPIIICSSHKDARVVSTAIELGATDYITKPVDKNILLGKITKALEEVRTFVLIVNSNPVVLGVLSKIIEREGYRVLKACSGVEAMSLSEQNRVCAVIVEATNGDMAGLELMSALKAKHPKVSVILIPGTGAEFTREKLLAAGADGVITKPFKNLEIAARLAAVVR